MTLSPNTKMLIKSDERRQLFTTNQTRLDLIKEIEITDDKICDRLHQAIQCAGDLQQQLRDMRTTAGLAHNRHSNDRSANHRERLRKQVQKHLEVDEKVLKMNLEIVAAGTVLADEARACKERFEHASKQTKQILELERGLGELNMLKK